MAKILVAEDEAHILRIMSLWLTRHGHEVVEAPNGTAALEVLGRERVDMVISDMNMPQLDGLGLVKAIRMQLGIQVPIMLITARCDQGELAEQLAPYHVQLYPKPFVPSRLVADISRVLEGPAPVESHS